MAKINDKFKKAAEDFSNKVKMYTRLKPKKERLKPITTDKLTTEINDNIKRNSSFIDKFKFKKSKDNSGIQDTGINQDALDNKNILYNTDTTTNAPRKMRRIASRKDDTYNTLEEQQKSLSYMYKNQSAMMIRFHSEKMALTNKYQNESLKYIKNISEQVEQMNKMKSNIQLEFYKNSTTTQSAILEELKTINKTLKTGFNLNDRGERVVNKETDSLIKGFFNGSGSLTGKAKQLVMQLAKGEANSMGLGMATSLVSMAPTILQTMGGVGGLFTAGGKTIIDNLVEGQASKSRYGRQAMSLMKDPGMFLENMFTSMGLTEKGLKGWLGRKLGRKGDKVDSAYDISRVLMKDNKGRANFDNAAHTALTRVITRSLANIESVLSGKPAMFYNYETNRFETIEEADRALKSGYSAEVKKEIDKLTKSISSNQTIEVKNAMGGGTHTETKFGMWGELLKIKNDVHDANLKFVQDAIKMRGPELGNYLTKLIVFLSKHTSSPEQILESDLDIKLIMKAIYGDKYGDAPKQMIDKFANSAMSFKMFIEALRDLPTKEGQQVWDRLISETKSANENITKAMDRTFASAEGSVAQWAAYTYGEVIEEVEKDGKKISYMRGKTREELDKEYYENRKDYDFAKLSGMSIDISGITSDWQLAERLKDEYNRMLGPLFRGTNDKIKQNLKKKVRDLKKSNHPFAEYVEKLSNAYSKFGDNMFNYDDYKNLEGVNSYTDLEEKFRKPSFQGYDISSTIDSAKNIAKWHMEHNPKAKGIAGGVSAAAYGTLISTMAKNSGMTGPIGSAIIGVGAAASLVFSGKMTKVMDVMTTSLGDEKMLDKNGNETNVTKRQAMQEAFYRETLPKGIGYGAGMKLGGWIRNNIRFGPILGPVIGLGTGFILSKTSSLAMKLVGLFGSFGKKLLNGIGKKITGDEYSNWGDTVRDLVREKLGLAPVGSETFTMKEVLAQSGEKKSKMRNFVETFTGQRGSGTTSDNVIKKPDIEQRYKRAREMYKLMHGPKNNPYGETADTEELGGEVKDPLTNVRNSLSKTMSSVLNLRVIGGHLDAIGVIGAVDAEAYKTKLATIHRNTANDINKASPGADKREVDQVKSSINMNMANAMSFVTNDKDMKHNFEDQDKQEATERANRENIEKIAKGETGGKEKKERPKKKGKWWITLGLAGLLFGGDAIKAGKKIVPKLFDSLVGMFFGKDGKKSQVSAAGESVGKSVKTGIKGIDTVAKGYIGKAKKEYDKLPTDDKISRGIDAFRILKDNKSRKFLANVAKRLPGVKGAMFAGKYFFHKAGQRLSEDTEKFVVKTVGKGASKVAEDTVEATGKNIIKNARDAKKIGRITYWTLKALDLLENLIFKIPGVKKFAKKVAKPVVDRLKEWITKTIEKLATKFLGESLEKAGKKGILGTIKGALSTGVVTAAINLAFIAWDAWQGAKKAKEFFGISENDKPTKIQQWSCAIMYGMLSLIECIPGCVIVTAIISSIDSIMRECCFVVYEALNPLLTDMGMGDSAMEAVEQKILRNEKQDTSGKVVKGGISVDTAKKMNDAQLKMKEEGRSDEEIHRELQRIAREGGKGYTSPVTGKTAKGKTPNFVSQRSLPDVKVGKLHAQVDGCALAVMKMIAQSRNYNISDKVLISKMREYTLANKTVSVGFFKDFGAQITDKREDIQNALNSGIACMALLINNKGYQHFIAVIAKDHHNVYVGDPLKDSWEVMSNNDRRLISYAIAAGIFSGSVSSTLKVVTKGGRGVGGFGTKARELSSTTVNALNTAIQNAGITNIFNNGSGDPGWVEDTSTNNSDTSNNNTSNDTPVEGGMEIDVSKVKNNGGWSWKDLPAVSGKGYNNLKPLIDALSSRFGIPATAIAALMAGESGLNPSLRPNGAGYAGLGQFRKDSWHARIHEYEGKLYGVPEIGAGGDLYDARQSGTLYTMSMAHDALALSKKGIKPVTAGHLHLGHMLPTTIRNAEKLDTPLINLTGVTKAMIYQNSPITSKGYKKKSSESATLREGIAQDNRWLKERLAEHMGGNGGERLYWGRGAIGGNTLSHIKKVFTRSDWVEGRLKLPKNTACGLAVGLMIQKLVYPNQAAQFTPEEMHAWAKRTGAYDKNMGVTQNFFIKMGMKDLKLDKIAEDVRSGVKGKIILGELAYGKWKLQGGELAVIGANGHWYILVRPLDASTCYIMDPNHKVVESMNILKKNLLIDWALQIVSAGDIVNILSSNIVAKNSPSSNNKTGTTDAGQPGAATDGTTTETTDSNQSSGSGAETKPNRGTSASFGGWFFKDKDGNIEQAFFGNLTKRVRPAGGGGGGGSGNNGGGANGGIISGVTGAAFPNMKDTLNLPIIPALKLKDGDKPFEAAKYCVKGKKGDHYIDPGQCKEYVAKALSKAGYPGTVWGTWRQGSQDRAAGRGIPSGPNSSIDQQIGLPPDFGFTMISVQSPPQPGDVAIIWPFGKHESGHVEMYCGPEAGAKQSGWVSDFDQRRNTPYSESNPNNGYGRRITMYRDSNFCAKPTGMSGGGSVPKAGNEAIPTASSNATNNKKTQNTAGKGIGGGDDDKVLEYNSKSAANYYSKGSPSRSNTRKIVDRTIEQARNTPTSNDAPPEEKEKLGANGRPIKQFHMNHDPSRNMNREMRDRMAKAKYDREMRKIHESNHYKRWGVFDVMYKDRDTVIEKTLSTASGYIQDIETKSPLINALLKLSGSLVDNAVQTRNGTKEMLAMAEQQTELLELQKEATEDASKALEEKDKVDHTIYINSHGKPMSAEDITESFIKLFVNENGEQKQSGALFAQP